MVAGYNFPSLFYLAWGEESNQEKPKMVWLCHTSFRHVFLMLYVGESNFDRVVSDFFSGPPQILVSVTEDKELFVELNPK